MEKEGILEQIFNSRVDELASLTAEDRQTLKGKKEKIVFDETFKCIAENDRQKFEQLIETEIENMSCEMGYFCEKYYKNGFADGIKLIVECLHK